MKRVTLNQITASKSDKQTTYTVYLGNGTIHPFTSSRLAKQFLNQTSQFLTQQLYEARQLYAEIQNDYNHSWGYFRNNFKTGLHKLYQDDIRCKILLEYASKAFDLIIERSFYANGNYFAFTHLTRITENLKQVLQILQYLCKKQSNTAKLYQYDSLFNRILSLENNITNYSQSKSYQFFKVPTHSILSQSQQYIPNLKVA